MGGLRSGVTAVLHRLHTLYAALDRDQRFAAGAAIALIGTMFLPWYEKSVVVPGDTAFTQDTISAFGAVSFVEAAIFLVAAGVLALLVARADKRPFHLPGGDGTVIFAAGLWATALIFYRVFDRPDVSGDAGTVGIQWGFFVAFVAAGTLAYAGQRIRHAGRPEPETRARRTAGAPSDGPDERAHRPRSEPAPPTAARPDPSPRPEPADAHAGADGGPDSEHADEAPTAVATTAGARRRNRAVTREDARQLTFDDPAELPPPSEPRPTRDEP